MSDEPRQDEKRQQTARAASAKEAVPKLRPIEAVHYKHEGQDMFCLRDPMRLSDRELRVSPDVFMIASLFNGERGVADVRVEFTGRFGMRIKSADVLKVVEALEKAHFLESRAFEEYRARLEEEFGNLDVRAPILPGSSYPAEPERIHAFLDAFFTEGDEAPGPPEARSGDAASLVKPLRGLIVPHIDLRRDGVTYAHAYRAMWERPPAEVVVLVGTAHAGRGDLFTFTRKDFETPLGLVKNDADVTDRLASAVGERAFRDEYVHKGEHSIEIQLVWLQHMAEKYGGSCPRIVPVLTGSLHELVGSPDEGGASPMQLGEMERFVDALARVLREREGEVTLLASADLAHIGQRFGDEVPLTPRLLRRNGEEDRKMLSRVRAGDAEGFFEFVRAEKDRRRICGLTSIYACLAACDRAGRGSAPQDARPNGGRGSAPQDARPNGARDGEDEGVSARLLRYAQAPEEETQSLVSYAALAIE